VGRDRAEVDHPDVSARWLVDLWFGVGHRHECMTVIGS
jgi:hypothetical protein